MHTGVVVRIVVLFLFLLFLWYILSLLFFLIKSS